MAAEPKTPPPTKAFAFYAAELRNRAAEAEARAEFLASHNADLQQQLWQQQQRLSRQESLIRKLQGDSASRSSHPVDNAGEPDAFEGGDEEEEKEEEGEPVEGGDEEAPQEEAEEEEKEEEQVEAPTSDPEEKTKKLAPKPSQSPYLSSQAPAFSPSASRSSRPVSPSKRPSKKARK